MAISTTITGPSILKFIQYGSVLGGVKLETVRNPAKASPNPAIPPMTASNVLSTSS
jgi:hypothetical protein